MCSGGGGSSSGDAKLPSGSPEAERADTQLVVDASPIEVRRARQWKRKLVAYICRFRVPNWTDILDLLSVFFWCMESTVEDRVMHHDWYRDHAAVLPAKPVPDGSSLFNRRLEFFKMRQRTGEGEMVEQFVELLEAQAREAEVHLMDL